MQPVTCKINSIEKLNNFLYRIFLTPNKDIPYKAGQYISIIMGEGDKRHFSIANGPQNKGIELHIGATEDNTYAMQVIEKIQNDGEIEAEVGNGGAYLRETSQRPIILVAGGTGLAYVKSLLEQIVSLKLPNPVYLYWGVKKQQDFYFESEAIEWAKKHTNVHFHPVVELPDNQWLGHKGYVHKAVLSEFSDLSAFDIYVVGRFEMAKIARQDFLAQGAVEEHLFGDAYAFM